MLKCVFQILILFSMLALISVRPTFAVNPNEILPDAQLEQRARDLSSIIRCMKCQNQSIDDSDADLAKDLRILVRERLTEGDSDQQVLDYLVDRYGEFVLLKPQFSISNLALWGIPVLAFLLALFFSWRIIGNKQDKSAKLASSDILSDHENTELTKILNERE
jgi:cytochrome c-type biogenesis protein CcmH